MLKQFSEEELLGRQLSGKQERELRALRDKGDEDIDCSDIPEIHAIPANAVRGRFLRPNARSLPTIHLEEGLMRTLSEIAVRKGVRVDDLVNELLKKELEIAEALR